MEGEQLQCATAVGENIEVSFIKGIGKLTIYTSVSPLIVYLLSFPFFYFSRKAQASPLQLSVASHSLLVDTIS